MGLVELIGEIVPFVVEIVPFLLERLDVRLLIGDLVLQTLDDLPHAQSNPCQVSFLLLRTMS
jgi:hypothetical protein